MYCLENTIGHLFALQNLMELNSRLQNAPAKTLGYIILQGGSMFNIKVIKDRFENVTGLHILN